MPTDLVLTVGESTAFLSPDLEATNPIEPNIRPKGMTAFRGLRGLFEILWKRICSTLLETCHLVKPTIFLRYCSRKPLDLSPTAHFDGLRGVASLIVAMYHFSNAFCFSVTRGWGSSQSDYHVLQFYFVRVLISGFFMVAIFFVISGFVLSHKAIRLSREGQYTKLLTTLSSSTFRRWIRLMLPSTVSMLIYFCFLEVLEIPDSPLPPQKASFTKRLQSLFLDAINLSNPWLLGQDFEPKAMNAILWTIPLEYTGSLLIFLLVLSLARIRTIPKLAILAELMIHGSFTRHRSLLLFIGGIMIAEIDILRSTLKPLSQNQSRLPKFAIESVHFGAFALGIFLGSHPFPGRGMATSPGYITMYRLIPASWQDPPWHAGLYWTSIGALLVVGSISVSTPLQWFFKTRGAQYLGEVSFSLYLLHLTYIDTLGKWMEPQIGTVGTGVVMMVVLVWWCDLFTRGVDQGAVALAKKVEWWLLAEKGNGGRQFGLATQVS